MVNMWRCNLCLLNTSRRGNVVRHIREVHKINDPNAQNATKESNTGVKSNGNDKTSKDSNGLQSRMMGAEIPLSEERYPSMNSPERMLQDSTVIERMNVRWMFLLDITMDSSISSLKKV